MNRLENWFCSTNFWRSVTRDHLLPRMLDGAGLNGAEPRAHVLELGAGLGAATPELLQRFSRVTSLEYSAAEPGLPLSRPACEQIAHRGTLTSGCARRDAAQ